MTGTFVPLLPPEQVAQLPPRAREVIEYRKSGLSLNHVQGCPLDCAYCIRHTYGLWDGPLFRKTSCAVSYAHGLPDYNGHVSIRELCDICPASQLKRCERAHRIPTERQLERVADDLPETRGLQVVELTDRAAVVSGLPDEQPRYFIQHALGFQVHDAVHPHRPHRHGRAEIGWGKP